MREERLDIFHDRESAEKTAEMQSPEDYDKVKVCAKKFVLPLLDKMKIKLGNDQKILDFGCGTGLLASTYLLPVAEQTNSKIVCLDISEKMTRYASKNHSNDRTKFICGDITSDEFQFEIEDSSFDHIFSFLVMHFIKDYRKALEKFKEILKPGGKCGLIVVAKHNQFSIYKLLSQDPKWSRFMEGYEQFCPDWLGSAEPGETSKKLYKKAALDVGFKILELSSVKGSHIYDTLTNYTLFMNTLIPFDIPKEMHSDLNQSIISHICAMEQIPDSTEFHAKPFEDKYELMTIVLEKTK